MSIFRFTGMLVLFCCANVVFAQTIWTIVSPLPNSLDKVLWNGKELVAYGGQKYYVTSRDGATWTKHEKYLGVNLDMIKYDGNRFISKNTANEVVSSIDGISWTVHYVDTVQHPNLYDSLNRYVSSYFSAEN
jgi:hypothetical protein